jgi:Secretion system C-terminal sorting domain
MKLRLILIGIAIFLMGSVASNAQHEINWDSLFTSPCDSWQPHVTYSKVKTKVFCSSDLPGDPCPGCCFTLAYFDAYEAEDDDVYVANDTYYFSIAGLYWDREYCENCDREELLKAIVEKHLSDKSQDPEFIRLIAHNKLPDGSDAYTERPIFKLTIEGKCLVDGSLEAGDERLCGQGKICCVAGFNFSYDPQTFALDTIDWHPMTAGGSNCPADSCRQYCFNPTTGYLYDEMWKRDTLCDNLSCPYGEWVPSFLPLIITPDAINCPDCELQIHYETRQTPDDCEEGSFIDIRINSIVPTDCDGCGISFDDIMTSVIDSVLKEVSTQNIPLHGCEDRMRVSMASCWGYFFDNALDKDVILPCSTQSCCWARYEVCHPQLGVFTKNYIEGNVGDSADCHVNPHPCEMICGLLEDSGVLGRAVDGEESKLSGIDKSIIIPNPTSGLTDIVVKSDKQGIVKIEIIDARGIKIVSKEIEKTGWKLRSTFDLSKQPNGIYFYRVYIDRQLQSAGKISLIK